MIFQFCWKLRIANLQRHLCFLDDEVAGRCKNPHSLVDSTKCVYVIVLDKTVETVMEFGYRYI